MVGYLLGFLGGRFLERDVIVHACRWLCFRCGSLLDELACLYGQELIAAILRHVRPSRQRILCAIDCDVAPHVWTLIIVALVIAEKRTLHFWVIITQDINSFLRFENSCLSCDDSPIETRL